MKKYLLNKFTWKDIAGILILWVIMSGLIMFGLPVKAEVDCYKESSIWLEPEFLTTSHERSAATWLFFEDYFSCEKKKLL